MSNSYIAVKFEGQDQLPPILNALETDNGGNKLILEVAVREKHQQDIPLGWKLMLCVATSGRERRTMHCYGWYVLTEEVLASSI